MDEDFRQRARGALERARRITHRSSPAPWDASDSGYVSDKDGFVVCHLTARRGAARWDWERNPNAAFIAEARELVPELAALLQSLLDEDP